MNTRLLFYVLGLLLLTVFFSCEKEVVGEVEIYLLSEFTTVDNSYEIVSGTEQLEGYPLITYDDIVSYDEGEYAFEITVEAKLKISDSLNTKAFAVTVDEKVVYTGYFWSSLSSYAIDWLVVFPLFVEFENKISVRLSGKSGEQVPDPRKSNEITRIFKRDNKLK